MTDLMKPPVAHQGNLASETEAREVAEAARETEWQAPSFVRELFDGSFRLDLIHPFPAPNPEDLDLSGVLLRPGSQALIAAPQRRLVRLEQLWRHIIP